MAVIPKTVSTPGLATKLPCGAHRMRPLTAGETIAERDLCYIKTDGTVWRSNGTTVGSQAAKCHGIALLDYLAGDAITLYHGIDVPYGNGTETPGSFVYVAATAGALDSAATAGGTAPCGLVVANVTNEGPAHSIITIRQTTY